MSEGTPPEVPTPSPEDVAQMFAAVASGMPTPEPPPARRALRSKLIAAVLIAGVGVGASAMSCVGQSFSLRQARALEGIEQQLVRIQANCPAMTPRENIGQ